MRATPRVTAGECRALHAALLALGVRGPAHAQSRHALRRRLADEGGLALSDRVFRALVAAAPSYGFPLVSSVDGYYVATDAEGVTRCIADLESRRQQLAARAAALRTLVSTFSPAPVQQPQLWATGQRGHAGGECDAD